MMPGAWAHELEAWHDFFLLAGTAGVTLTGLLFVVVSLGQRALGERPSAGVRAFISPNAVFFTTTLVVSATLLVPALAPSAMGALLCAGALGSLAYLGYARAHGQWRRSTLPFLDWVWYVGLPFASYALLLVSGIGVLLRATLSLYAAALALLILLVAGIRNAWDLVLWVSRTEYERSDERRR